MILNGLGFVFVSQALYLVPQLWQRPIRQAQKARSPRIHCLQNPSRFEHGLGSGSSNSQKGGIFVLATHQIDPEALTPETLLFHYKGQSKIERGFRFLTDPYFLTDSLFLKKPERITALMMIMTLCLLVYAALENRIRKQLEQHQETFPDQKNKPTQRPTARWVFYPFKGVHVLSINTKQTLVLNLKPHHSALLKLLGPPYQKLYS